MSEPSASRMALSSTRLAAVRRRTGDYSDRTIVEACAVGLAYWATGAAPDGMELTPATPFADVLERVHNGSGGNGGRPTEAECLTIAVPAGTDPVEAQQALDDLVDFPDRPVGTIGPSGPRARAEELARWNDTRVDRVRPTVMELFREQACLRPDAVAIVDEHRSLTYREVDRLSAQLAHHLIERGLGPEQVV
ncbi:AMP-binding protein, partial [Streptomyces anulatus]